MVYNFRFMVERLFLQCIVPYALKPENRMKRLLTMFAYIDDNSRKAFSTMLKAQTQWVFCVLNFAFWNFSIQKISSHQTWLGNVETYRYVCGKFTKNLLVWPVSKFPWIQIFFNFGYRKNHSVSLRWRFNWMGRSQVLGITIFHIILDTNRNS